jgi:hypothetical protein
VACGVYADGHDDRSCPATAVPGQVKRGGPRQRATVPDETGALFDEPPRQSRQLVPLVFADQPRDALFPEPDVVARKLVEVEGWPQYRGGGA